MHQFRNNLNVSGMAHINNIVEGGMNRKIITHVIHEGEEENKIYTVTDNDCVISSDTNLSDIYDNIIIIPSPYENKGRLIYVFTVDTVGYTQIKEADEDAIVITADVGCHILFCDGITWKTCKLERARFGI